MWFPLTRQFATYAGNPCSRPSSKPYLREPLGLTVNSEKLALHALGEIIDLLFSDAELKSERVSAGIDILPFQDVS